MNKKTWHTIKDGKIDRIQITRENEKPFLEDLEWIEDPPMPRCIPKRR
jgi:hypothetical protein